MWLSTYLASLLEVGGQRGDELIGGHVLDGSQLDGHLPEDTGEGDRGERQREGIEHTMRARRHRETDHGMKPPSESDCKAIRSRQRDAGTTVSRIAPTEGIPRHCDLNESAC